MKTSLEALLKNANRLYQNMEKLLIAFHNVDNGVSENIKVTLVDENGDDKTYVIKNNAYLQNEVNRLKNNFDNITNPNNPTYLLKGDGSLEKFFKTDFSNNGYIKELSNGVSCVIFYDSIIDNLTFPNVKLPIKIDNDIVETEIKARIYTIESGFDKIPTDDLDIQKLEFLLQNRTVYGDMKTMQLQTQKQQIRSHGKFDIINVEATNDENIFICKLNDIDYKKINSNAKLVNGDVVSDNISKYQVIDVDGVNNVIKIKRIEGKTIPKIGIKNLVYNAVIDTNNKYVNIPVLPNRNIVVFLSTENDLSTSFPSLGIKINTSNLTVYTDADGTITLKQYYQKYVTNITEYFESLVNDASVPLSLGIKPPTIKLDPRNFQVLQINKHLTNKLTREELEKLNTEKTKIKGDIDFRNNKIEQLEKELSTKTLKTKEEVNYRNNKIKEHREQIILLEQNFLVVTRKINDNAVKYGLKHSKPKYKIIGFCQLLEDILSTKTRPQKIIKYEFWYRYLSKNNDEVNATSFKMYNKTDSDDSNTIKNITVSPWNIAKTKTLQKVKNDNNGKFEWVESRLDSSEDININQCMISINEGESVEIKVRAISEAGYPVSTLKADWSNILRIDFPPDLTENSVNLLVNRNVDDLKIAEFQEIIRQSGLYEHLSGTLTDGTKKYPHSAFEIASGFHTNDERKIIPLFDWMTDIQSRVSTIENRKATENLVIQFVDFKGDVYNIENNASLEINGGAYNDSLNLLNKEDWGTIITQTNYIKIVNNNDIPVEIKSLIPGANAFNAVNAPQYHNVPIFGQNSFKQKNKQIIYFRNIDITKQTTSDFELYVNPLGKGSNTIPSALINTNVNDADRDLIYLDGVNAVKKCKLQNNNNTNFVVFSREHPLYVPNDNAKMAELVDEFKRLSKINGNIKIPTKQEKLNSDLFLGFKVNDKYAVGKNTTGAFVYPIFNNESKFTVIGNNTTSSVIIPKKSELILPIIFQYRMTDRLGVINGDNSISPADNISYSKKIGADLLINNELLSFDLEFKAKLKSEIPSIESLNVPGIISNVKKSD